MTADNHLSEGAKFLRRRASTPRVAVDHNGHPTGPPIAYVYDAAGHLISADGMPDAHRQAVADYLGALTDDEFQAFAAEARERK